MSLSRSATWTQRPGSPRKELHRLPEVVEPADALLPLDRHPGRVDLALERGGPPELRPRPDLRGGHSERHPLLRDGEAGVQEEAAEGVGRHRPLASRPLLTLLVTPIAVVEARWKTNSVVSCSSRITPRHALKRSRVAAKWPPRMSASSTR